MCVISTAFRDVIQRRECVSHDTGHVTHPYIDSVSHVCDLCLFSYPDVCFLSRYVMFNIFLSIFVCAAAGLFFA